MSDTNRQLVGNGLGCRGFTLIEVLIALAIFSIGILAVFALQIRSINQNVAARIQGEAANVGALTMERLIALPYLHDDLDEARNPHRQTVGFYQVEWNIRLPDPADPDYHFISVKVIDVTVTSGNPNTIPISLSFIKGAGT